MMTECSNDGFRARMREAATRNKTALLHHITIDVPAPSLFSLVREIEEKLLVADTTRSMEKATDLPRSYAAGRI